VCTAQFVTHGQRDGYLPDRKHAKLYCLVTEANVCEQCDFSIVSLKLCALHYNYISVINFS